MLDLLITHATLPDGRRDMSVAVQGERIVQVRPAWQAPAHSTVDAGGLLLSPPFVDAHFHLDSALTYGQPRTNASGTLLEGIALWGELKPQLTYEAIVERALRYCDWAVARGLLAIRSHVDTSSDHLLAVQALLDVQRRVAPYLDLQLVAFPQDGLLRQPQGLANLRRRATVFVVSDFISAPGWEKPLAQLAQRQCAHAARHRPRANLPGAG